VVGSDALVLGIEASEDVSARGDVTSEFAQIVAACSGRQAFRVGRVQVAAGVRAEPVPACGCVVLENDGQLPWPSSTAFKLLSGDAYGFMPENLGGLQPGETAEMALDFLLTSQTVLGTSRSVWALMNSAGWPLGPVLIFEVVFV